MKVEELKTLLRTNGVVGAGGAGFPTHAKLSSDADIVILNSAECEPLLRVDRQLTEYYTEEILQAFTLVVETLGARKGIYVVKAEYEEAIYALNLKINNYPNLEIKILDNVYPGGDEVVLVYEATGRIVPEGGLPLDKGVVVINAETMLNIYKAVYEKQPVIEKYITVTGEVNRPCTIKVPIGISISECIRAAGGTKLKEFSVIAGGPMMGKNIEIDDVVIKTTKAILILPKTHSIILKRTVKSPVKINRIMSVCSQCRMCTDLCPRNLLGHNIEPHRIMNALANGLFKDIQAFTSAFLCCECGLCENYSCYQGLSPATIIGELKARLREKGVKNPHNKVELTVNEFRNGRKVPMERLVARLGLTEYDNASILEDKLYKTGKVKLKLKQNAGIPSRVTVKQGNIVNKGDILGVIDEDKLGVFLHASISGVITRITEELIIIEANENIKASISYGEAMLGETRRDING